MHRVGTEVLKLESVRFYACPKCLRYQSWSILICKRYSIQGVQLINEEPERGTISTITLISKNVLENL